MDTLRLQETPNDSVLQELSRNIGNHTFHLGVELGLNMILIEETRCRYPGDMFAQTYDILKKWTINSKIQPTVRALMLTLQHVDSRGFKFLKDHYGVVTQHSADVKEETKSTAADLLRGEADVSSEHKQEPSSFVIETKVIELSAKAINSIGIIQGLSQGTCFRVGTDLILTAWHVIQQDVEDARGTHSVSVTFGYTTERTKVFEIETDVVYHNESLDTAILRLKPNGKSDFPPPFQHFYHLKPDEHEDIDVLLIGYQDQQQQLNHKVKLWNPSPKQMKYLNMFCSDKGYDFFGYSGLNNEKRIVLKCEFRGGASGCPGFVIIDDKLCLVTMFLQGYPRFYYSRHFESKRQNFPKEKLFQQGVSIEPIQKDLKQTNPEIYEDIFNRSIQI